MVTTSEKDLVKAVLLHPARYSLDLLGILQLRTTSDETIEMHVEYGEGEELPSNAHHLTKTPNGKGYIVTYSWAIFQIDEAVEFFLKTRQEREIGIDIEKELVFSK